MPKVKADNLTINYEQQGKGEPLILIPYLTADHACYAFQIAEYAKHFTCISIDLRGTGESEASSGAYSTETLADDVAALMQALGIQRAHVSGVSLGGATGMWLAAKYPDKVLSLSAHGAWTKTDPFLEVVVDSWQRMAKASGNMADTVVRCIFPWCLTPELYAAKPEYVQSLAEFVRSRPAQTVAAFIQQSNAVLAHDIRPLLGRIASPTLVTFGRHDTLTFPRFAAPLKDGIRNAELVVFEESAHAPLYERVEEFNEKTLAFLQRQIAAGTA